MRVGANTTFHVGASDSVLSVMKMGRRRIIFLLSVLMNIVVFYDFHVVLAA